MLFLKIAIFKRPTYEEIFKFIVRVQPYPPLYDSQLTKQKSIRTNDLPQILKQNASEIGIDGITGMIQLIVVL